MEITSKLSLDANPFEDINWLSFFSDLIARPADKPLFRTFFPGEAERVLPSRNWHGQEHKRVVIPDHTHVTKMKEHLLCSWELQKIEAGLFKVIRTTPKSVTKVFSILTLTKHVLSFLDAKSRIAWSVTDNRRHQWMVRSGVSYRLIVRHGSMGMLVHWWNNTAHLVTFDCESRWTYSLSQNEVDAVLTPCRCGCVDVVKLK
jgi:hypothetical protein